MKRAAAAAGPPVVVDFLRLVWAVDHGLRRLTTGEGARTGVTVAERLVIRTVGRFPGIPAGRLAELLQVEPGTLTGLVKRLERHGYVRRRPDARDGRRVLLGLTSKGRRFDRETLRSVDAALRRALDAVPPAQLRSTRRGLESIAGALAGETSGRKAPNLREEPRR